MIQTNKERFYANKAPGGAARFITLALERTAFFITLPTRGTVFFTTFTIEGAAFFIGLG